MSVIGRSIEGAIKKGQESMSANLKIVDEQNTTIIENMNEMIDLMKKICDKLEIDTNVKEANEE